METKICSMCKQEKELKNFYFHFKEKKYSNYCNECKKIYQREYNLKNKDKIKRYARTEREKHKEYYRLKNKKYMESHKQERKEYMKQWRKKNKDKILNSSILWRANNKDKIMAYSKSKMEKIKNEPLLKLEQQLRNMINTSFRRKGNNKSEKLELICGMHPKDLVNYLLKTYKQNYNEEWDEKEPVHIDHIIPLATANTEEGIIKLCNYSNLQLLKAKDNLSKGDRLDWKLEK